MSRAIHIVGDATAGVPSHGCESSLQVHDGERNRGRRSAENAADGCTRQIGSGSSTVCAWGGDAHSARRR